MEYLVLAPLQNGLIPRGTRVEVFQRIYWVFLILGTLVGVVVIGYMLHKAYKYRDRPDRDPDEDIDRPQLGEIPQGGTGGQKLLLSFTLSAIIVISLVVWTYGTLLFVERGDQQNPLGEDEETIQVLVEGYQFGWDFTYQEVPGREAGVESTNELRVPRDTHIRLNATSRDVFHNFGAPSLRVKVDTIPGHYTTQWFIGAETGSHEANCYELCGAGHSYMDAEIIVMEQDDFDQWYADSLDEADDGNETEA